VTTLRAQGYRFYTTSGLGSAQGRRVALSFDDNYRSWYQSRPLLDELELRVSFYLNTAPLRGEASPRLIQAYYDRLAHQGERIPLSWAELQRLFEDGHEIGAHSHAHECMSALSLEAAEIDLKRNLERLQKLGPIRHFALPFGMPRHFSPALEALCWRLGFESLAYAAPGMQHAPQGRVLQRSGYKLNLSLEQNLRSFGVDGRAFLRWTGRSPLG